MGAYLAKPVLAKDSHDIHDDNYDVGASSMQGWRVEQEDAHNVLLDFAPEVSSAYFAVYDGHGGAEVAEYTAKELPGFLRQLKEFKDANYEDALRKAFVDFDRTLTSKDAIAEMNKLMGRDQKNDEVQDMNEVKQLREEAAMPIGDVLEKLGSTDKNKPDEARDKLKSGDEEAGGSSTTRPRHTMSKKRPLNKDDPDQVASNKSIEFDDDGNEKEPAKAEKEVMDEADDEKLNGHQGGESSSINSEDIASNGSSANKSKGGKGKGKGKSKSKSNTIVKATKESDENQQEEMIDKGDADPDQLALCESIQLKQNPNNLQDLLEHFRHRSPQEDIHQAISNNLWARVFCKQLQTQEEQAMFIFLADSQMLARQSYNDNQGAEFVRLVQTYFDQDSKYFVRLGNCHLSDMIRKYGKAVSEEQSSMTLANQQRIRFAIDDSKVWRKGIEPLFIRFLAKAAGRKLYESKDKERDEKEGRLLGKPKGADELYQKYMKKSGKEGVSDTDDDDSDDADFAKDLEPSDESDIDEEAGLATSDLYDDGDEDTESDDSGDDDVNSMRQYLNGEPGNVSGCTAVVALMVGSELFVANAGDSRCVVCRNGKAIEMSFDHKPDDDEEMSRILNAEGKVNGEGRVNGGLNLSRALGDHAYKTNDKLTLEEQMISPLPDIQRLTINPNTDKFMILACDGIWNSMNSQEVVDFCLKRMEDNPREKLSDLASELFDNCLAPNTLGDGTGCDNMTAVIVRFKNLSTGGVKVASVRISRKRSATEDNQHSSLAPCSKKSKTEEPAKAEQGEKEQAEQGEKEQAEQGEKEQAEQGENEQAKQGENEQAEQGENEQAEQGEKKQAEQGEKEQVEQGEKEQVEQGEKEQVQQQTSAEAS